MLSSIRKVEKVVNVVLSRFEKFPFICTFAEKAFPLMALTVVDASASVCSILTDVLKTLLQPSIGGFNGESMQLPVPSASSWSVPLTVVTANSGADSIQSTGNCQQFSIVRSI